MIYLQLFWVYFKIGLFTIGGGYAMLAMVTQTMDNTGWITSAELADFIGVAESTPGPFAINLATFVGITVGSTTSLGVWGGLIGAVVATFAVVLPSLVIIIVVTKIFDKFKTNRYVQGALCGIRPVVVGLVLYAVVNVGSKVVFPNLESMEISKMSAESFSPFNWISLIIIAVFFPLSKLKIKGKKLHPILLILSSAVIGILVYLVYPDYVQE